MRYASIIASSSALFLRTAHASLNPSSHSYWSRDAPGRKNYNHNDDEEELESLEKALSGWERRSGISSPSSYDRGFNSASRSAHDKQLKAASSVSEDDIDFKKSKDWWKDPLAQFDGEDRRGRKDKKPRIQFDDDDDDNPVMDVPREDDFTFNLLPIRNRPPAFSSKDSQEGDEGSAGSTQSDSQDPASESSTRRELPRSKPFVREHSVEQESAQSDEKQIALRDDSSHRSLEIPLLLASLVPSSIRQVLSRVPAMQILALLAIGRQLYQWRSQHSLELRKNSLRAMNDRAMANRLQRGKDSVQNKPSEPESSDYLEDSDSDDDYLDEVPEAFRNNPRTRAVFERKKKKRSAPPVIPPVVESKPEKNKADNVLIKKTNKKRLSNKNKPKMMPVLSGGWTDGIFGPRRPSARQLMEKVASLEQAFQQAQQAKSNLERAYEQANWQLQESQTEFDKLKQTTKYLQAQLRDNEEMLENVVKQEQRKAKEEMMQMKEAMIKVIEREREAMREEFIKQAAELEDLWKESMTKRERRHGRSRGSSNTSSNNLQASI